jgi:hypothetical protein
MGGKIFVSHSSKDHKLAMTMCTALERRGIACWISSRDIGAGENFQEAIVSAIRGAPAMVLLFSRSANDSPEIKKELALASEYRVIVIPVRAEEVVPTGAFKYELATRQWVDLFANWEEAIERLAQQIKRVDAPGNTAEPLPTKPAARKRRPLALAALGGVGALVVIGAALVLLRPPAGSPPVAASATASTVEAPPPGPAVVQLRAVQAVVTRDDVAAALVRLDLYDAKRNGGGKGVKHQYGVATVGSAIVVEDKATALMWQRGGSSQEMTRADAASYIAKLNADRYAGYADWRLPTFEEAMSLMEAKGPDDYHIDAKFQRPPYFIWTADRVADSKSGIVVYYYDAVLSAESEDFNAAVRAVRGTQTAASAAVK